jgi:hypothetical protein
MLLVNVIWPLQPLPTKREAEINFWCTKHTGIFTPKHVIIVGGRGNPSCGPVFPAYTAIPYVQWGEDIEFTIWHTLNLWQPRNYTNCSNQVRGTGSPLSSCQWTFLSALSITYQTVPQIVSHMSMKLLHSYRSRQQYNKPLICQLITGCQFFVSYLQILL